MSTKVKTVRLQNYCGYQNTTFDFTDSNGKVKDFAVFFGPNGIGKSVTKSCNIFVDGKMLTIGDLFPDVSGEPRWIPLDKPVQIGINGTEGVCRRLYYSGKKKSITLLTSCGYSLTGSYDRHIVLGTKTGIVGFDWFKHATLGDRVAISRKSIFPAFGGVSESEAMLLGYLVSEGYTAAEYGIYFFNSDEDVLRHYETLHSEVFGEPSVARTRREGSNNRVVYTSQSCRLIADLLGLTRSLSGDKRVPSSVREATRPAVAAFLRTYFEGDGGVEATINAITCASKSYQLLHEVHLLLLRLGIVSSLHPKRAKKLSYVDKPYNSWRITIQGADVLTFAREIGFVSSRKRQELDDLLITMAATDRDPNHDVVPVELVAPLTEALREFRCEAGIEFSRADYKNTSNGLHCLQPNYLRAVKKGVSRSKVEACVATINARVRELNYSSGGVDVAEEIDLDRMTEGLWSENYFFDTIESITEGEDELFDLEVENDHRFWTNGFISHNSTVLDAIRMGANPNMFGRGGDDPQDRHASLMRKYIHDVEYIPSVDAVQTISKVKNHMEIEVVFDTSEGDKRVLLDNLGLKINELPPSPQRGGYVFYGDADHPMSTQKFMLAAEQAQTFLEFCEEVYGYECILASPVKVQGIGMYTDFIIRKGDIKVHFKRMSAGERKIATLVSDLCQPINTQGRDIILVDNVEMHIYWKRHTRCIDKLRSCFPGKQIITTTHSAIVIDHVEPEFHFDLEHYRPEYRLFDGEIETVENTAEPVVQSEPADPFDAQPAAT